MTEHTVYLVFWQRQGIAKAGITTGRRHKGFPSGCRVVGSWRLPTARDARDVEAALLELLSSVGGHAFDAADQAKNLLGHGGMGWTECFRVTPEALEAVASYVCTTNCGGCPVMECAARRANGGTAYA